MPLIHCPHCKTPLYYEKTDFADTDKVKLTCNECKKDFEFDNPDKSQKPESNP
jgi:uncharacterized protein YbaR (Trm112 family)